jgi:hypothetical protein
VPRALGVLVLACMVGSSPVRADETYTTKVLSIGGGEIELAIEDGNREQSHAAIEAWVRRAAVAVSSFYGRYPVPRVRLVVFRVPGGGIGGTTYRGRLIHIRLGVATPTVKLEHDWTMTHEMFHLGFPDLDRRHAWMEEGFSTYFEPIARARVGDLATARHWRELFSGLPQGLPDATSGGLEETPTWGATYWGGALFWFLADLEIREQTQNRHSADDAVRAILAAGGDGAEHWSIDRVLQVGDEATGTRVLHSVYQRLGRSHFTVDLRALAERLGVAGDQLDDRAPLAAVRRAITDPRQNPGDPDRSP